MPKLLDKFKNFSLTLVLKAPVSMAAVITKEVQLICSIFQIINSL